MALHRRLADTCSGKRTIDTHEGALCEPCASGPSKTPKLGPCESSPEEDEERVELDELVEEIDDDDEEEDEATTLDVTDTDPVHKGSQTCVIESCNKFSTWGPIHGEKNSACFCAPHGKAHDGYENVRSKRCEAPGCKSKSPKFGPVGGLPKTATCCSDHGKLKGYVDLVQPRCNQDGCDTYASYGLLDGKPIRCIKHHDPTVHIDRKNTKCDQTGCGKRASFGLSGGKRIRCGSHREDYVYIGTKLRQHTDGCSPYPSDGAKFEWPAFCAEYSDTPQCALVELRDPSKKRI